MGDLLRSNPELLDQSLARFIFPGTHDSGTYEMELIPACENCQQASLLLDIEEGCESGEGPFGEEELIAVMCGPANEFVFLHGGVRSFAEAQKDTVLEQLEKGARSLDLRFFLPNAEEAARTDPFEFADPLSEDEFYIHHTLVGPSLTTILADLETFLDAHPDEVVLLFFTKMYETDGPDGEMSSEAMAEFFSRLYASIGQHMAPRALGEKTSLRQLLDLGKRVVVAYDAGGGNAAASSGLCELARATGQSPHQLCDVPEHIRDLIWANIDSAGTPGGNLVSSGYPKAEDWNTEDEMLEIMLRSSTKRDDPEEMFRMLLAFGADDSGKMIKRKFICSSGGIVAETIDPDLCAAHNDDWDQFQNLEDVAEYLHPKMLGSLVALPRDSVNVVHVDHYPEELTDEVIQLMKGAARVELDITRVRERGCHDDFSDPDYYPYVELTPTIWEGWGGRHLEKTDDADYSPNWRVIRSVPAEVSHVALELEIWDRDNSSHDDQSDITPGSGRALTLARPVAGCLEHGVCLPTGPFSSEGGGCDALVCLCGDREDSEVDYTIDLCRWEDCGDSAPNADLGVELSAPETVLAGDEIAYRVSYANHSSNAVFGAVRIDLPSGVSSPESSGANCFGTVCVLSATFPGNFEGSFVVEAMVDAGSPDASTEIAATATAATDAHDFWPANDSSTVTTQVHPPTVAVCEDITVVLDASGDVVVAADQVGGNSTGNVQDMVLAPSAFDCGDLGSNLSFLTVTGISGTQGVCTSRISVIDRTPPKLTGVPAHSSVECDAVPTPADPSASDTCDSDVHIRLHQNRQTGSCAHEYSLRRTWTATDESGNFDIDAQTISVTDTTAPALLDVPASQTVQCDAVPDAAVLSAADNCDDGVSVSFQEERVAGRCANEFRLERSWTATDDCANATVQTQEIQVLDDSAPSWTSALPADLAVEFGTVVDPALPSAADDCASEVAVSSSDESTQSADGSCSDFSYVITRTYRAADACQNEVSHEQRITVVDSVAPELILPADADVGCDGDDSPDALGRATATDVADPNLAISWSDVPAPGNTDGTLVQRIWKASDACGNESVGVQRITFPDPSDADGDGVPDVCDTPDTLQPPTLGAPAPVLAAVSVVPVYPGAAETLARGVCTNYYGDRLQLEVDWDDGEDSRELVNGAFELSHVYATAGLRDVHLRCCDGAHPARCAEATVTIQSGGEPVDRSVDPEAPCTDCGDASAPLSLTVEVWLEGRLRPLGVARKAKVLVRLIDSDGARFDYPGVQLSSAGHLQLSVDDLPMGDYTVEIHHRHHLAIASRQTIRPSASGGVHLDLKAPASVRGAGALRCVADGRCAMRAGDLDQDGKVGNSDFSLMMGKWLSGSRAADIDGDGRVFNGDYVLWQGNYRRVSYASR